MPYKALDSEDLFQVQDCRRKARLRHVERAGRCGDTTVVSYGDQVSKLLQSVVHHSSISRRYSLQQNIVFLIGGVAIIRIHEINAYAICTSSFFDDLLTRSESRL